MASRLTQQKHRVREKQLLMIEMIKQRVAFEKLKQRNIEFINSALMGEEINLSEAMAHRPQN